MTTITTATLHMLRAPSCGRIGGGSTARLHGCDVVDWGQILGPSVSIDPSHHPAIRELHRPLPQGLGLACLAPHHVCVVLAPCIVPGVALVTSVPFGCSAGGVSP